MAEDVEALARKMKVSVAVVKLAKDKSLRDEQNDVVHSRTYEELASAVGNYDGEDKSVYEEALTYLYPEPSAQCL